MTWTTLKAYLNTLIGTYSAVQINGNNYLDIPWIMSAILLILVLHWFFKFLFGAFRK